MSRGRVVSSGDGLYDAWLAHDRRCRELMPKTREYFTTSELAVRDQVLRDAGVKGSEVDAIEDDDYDPSPLVIAGAWIFAVIFSVACLSVIAAVIVWIFTK